PPVRETLMMNEAPVAVAVPVDPSLAKDIATSLSTRSQAVGHRPGEHEGSKETPERLTASDGLGGKQGRQSQTGSVTAMLANAANISVAPLTLSAPTAIPSGMFFETARTDGEATNDPVRSFL